VTNPDNGREIRVVVTDHGPFAGRKVERPDGSGEKVHSRVIDLSQGASDAIGMGYTVKNLKYQVESIPEEGKWGKDRRNIHGDYRRKVQSDVRRISRERGVNA
jgi:rare lipoprotein A (peptidoglycan hydrolase)